MYTGNTSVTRLRREKKLKKTEVIDHIFIDNKSLMALALGGKSFHTGALLKQKLVKLRFKKSVRGLVKVFSGFILWV